MVTIIARCDSNESTAKALRQLIKTIIELIYQTLFNFLVKKDGYSFALRLPDFFFYGPLVWLINGAKIIKKRFL